MRLALAKGRRLYAGCVTARARQTGRLFQERFGSDAMDEVPYDGGGALRGAQSAPARRVGRAWDSPIPACARISSVRDDGLARAGAHRGSQAVPDHVPQSHLTRSRAAIRAATS